jgi:hypothetical protein
MNSTRNNQNCVTPEKWMNDKNGSLFIKYIPNDITKTILRDIFGFLGKIARIDIVNISENGSGRRAFIHFHEWNNEPSSKLLRKSICENYPTHVPYSDVNFSPFVFSITLNSRPIPTSELNVFQLQDWNQRLNDEFCDYKKESEAKIAFLTEQNRQLFAMFHQMNQEMMIMKMTIHPENNLNFYKSPHFVIDDEEIHYEDEECDWVKEEMIMNEIQDEIDRIHDNPLFDEYNQDEIDNEINRDLIQDEIEFFDLDSVEAGMRRVRDPMIYQKFIPVN